MLTSLYKIHVKIKDTQVNSLLEAIFLKVLDDFKLLGYIRPALKQDA